MKQEFANHILDKVRDDYNETAQEFSATRQFFWPEMGKIFNFIKPENNVLDFGCGNARVLPLVLEKNGKYFGVDISQELIKIAKQKYPEENLQVIDGVNLPFEENFFDVIYSIAVFHNVPSLELRLRILQEIKRVLRKDSFLILTVWQPKNKRFSQLFWKNNFLKILGLSKMDFRDLIEKWGNNSQRYYHLFSKKELGRMVRKSGLKIIETGTIKDPTGNRQNLYIVAKKA